MANGSQDISNLVYSYAELLDIGDLEGLAALFEHAVVRPAGSDHEFRGAVAVRSLIERTVQFYDGIPRTKHLVTNLIIEISDDGNSAIARSYYTALQAQPHLSMQPILAGRWHDAFEKVQGRWRFARRLIYTDLIGDISCHLKGFAQ
ncbi:nuclear transport factor 2 family protein [Mycobacterium sp. RTGN5]|uniref:nuclear transport factor 2 family protein n=1 Tax=Mycobacterium sp. RTGN5 TaxID=3016522 RepID=UPI0029C8C556|nr:nuclear transport factor 2 family protein [Mycobacterium sp. RTGN5]